MVLDRKHRRGSPRRSRYGIQYIPTTSPLHLLSVEQPGIPNPVTLSQSATVTIVYVLTLSYSRNEYYTCIVIYDPLHPTRTATSNNAPTGLLLPPSPLPTAGGPSSPPTDTSTQCTHVYIVRSIYVHCVYT